jgi:hypothetical protein
MKEENIDKLFKALTIINLLLIIVSNILVFWTWYNIITSNSPTDFIGLLLLPLFFYTIYYLILLNYGIKLVRQIDNSKDRIPVQSIIIFVLNVIPMALIYYVTA